MSYQDLTQFANRLRNAFVGLRNQTIQDHPDWQQSDVRLGVYARCANVLGSTHLAMLYFQGFLTQDQFWHDNCTPKLSPGDITINAIEFNRFAKVAFTQALVGAVESSFRLFLRAIDTHACSQGTDAFAKVYGALLNRLGLAGNNIDLLDLLRFVRNTVHNNGVYFVRNGQDQRVTYRGTVYRFEHGRAVLFTDWAFVLGLVPDVRELVRSVVESPQIAQIDFIEDPFRDSILPPP